MDATARQTYDAKEVARLFGVGIATVYRAAGSGDLSTFRVRRRLLFPRKEILALLHLADGAAARQPDTEDEGGRQVAA
jgi:excisionase family DNA binding protein